MSMLNGFLIIDKPQGWTSHDIVAKTRGILRTRAIGHAGTLDPLATGVLPLLIGGATKALDYLPNGKAYIAVLRVGIETDTQDITGNITAMSDTRPPNGALEALLPSFTGEQKQIPPMYSAIKIGGKTLYKEARAGREVERPARDVVIEKLELLSQDGDEYTIEVHCSGGTYIRTLCHDIGRQLGCLAAMTGLRRTMACNFTLDDAVTLDAVSPDMQLLPIDTTVFAQYPAITVTTADMTNIKNGKPIRANAECRIKSAELTRVYAPDGQFIMLGRVDDGFVKQVKRFGVV
ncbi:MAG: tRNA pseudouridine(55) synthase TruB [Oscillospiraceae bacterium]|nr:tRNA pseudouridine(55) synthase TruB [Oscillospiraceae bacterium]